MDYSQEIVDAARQYIAAIERCESTGKRGHDEKRQLAHNEFLWQLQMAGHKVNSSSYDDRSEATVLAYKIIRWMGSSY